MGLKNFPNVSNLINKIERLKLNKPLVLPKKTKANTRRKWMNLANIAANHTVSNKNKRNQNIFASNTNGLAKIAANHTVSNKNKRNENIFASNTNGLVKPPVYSLNHSSLNSIIIPRKPKYTFDYLVAKRKRGSRVTKENRNVVRLQQLKNYIESTNNPAGKNAAQREYNVISSQYNNTIRHKLR
jgi:hypothetical protein